MSDPRLAKIELETEADVRVRLEFGDVPSHVLEDLDAQADAIEADGDVDGAACMRAAARAELGRHGIGH
jgi:hypothetical protein